MAKTSLCIAFVLMICSAPSFAARHLIDLSLDINQQDDIDGLSTESNNIDIGIRYSRYQWLGPRSSYSTYGALYIHEQDISNDANYLKASLGGKHSYKLGNGFGATTWLNSLRIDRKEYTNDVFSHSTSARFKTGLKHQLTDKTSVKADLLYQANSNIYPEFVAMYWQSDDENTSGLSLQLDHKRGDHEFRIDQSFNEGTRFVATPYGMGQAQQRTWQDSKINTTTLGYNWAITHHSAIDLQARHYSASYKSRRYDSNAFSIAFLHRFEL